MTDEIAGFLPLAGDAGPSATDGQFLRREPVDVSSQANFPGASAPGLFARKWTDERNAYAEQAWKTGVPRPEIFRVVQAMPGLPLANDRAVKEQAKARGWRRPNMIGVQRAAEAKIAQRPWTPARDAKLAEIQQDKALNWGDIARLVSAVPALGRRPATINACRDRATELGLPPRRGGRPPPPEPVIKLAPRAAGMEKRHARVPFPQPPAGMVPVGIEAKRLAAAAAIRKAGKEWSALAIAGQTGLEAWQVCNVAGCLRHGWPVV